MWTIRGLLHCVLVCLFAALAACSSSGGDPYKPDTQPGVPASVEIVSGNHQTAAAGTELPQPLVGRMIDASGKALSNRTVNFVVISGGGSMSIGAVTSDGKGLFSARWTLGPGAGTQRVEVRGHDVVGPIVYASFESVATAGAAMSAAAIAETQRQAAKSSTTIPTPIAVSVVDLHGNARPGVRIWFTPCETCGSVDPASAMTNAGGIATTAWTLGKSAGTQLLSAHIEGLPAVRFEAIATPAASAAAASVAARQGDGQTVEQHARNTQPLGVFVSDAQGAGVPGVAVDFLPAPGSPYFVAQSINTDANGYADFTAYFHDAGAVRIQAVVEGIEPATFDLVVAPTPFEYDGDFICRLADAPDAPYAMSVRQNFVSVGGPGTNLAADGSFAVEWRSGEVRRQLQGKLELGVDGGAMATGTTMDAAAPTPWNCERL